MILRSIREHLERGKALSARAELRRKSLGGQDDERRVSEVRRSMQRIAWERPWDGLG